MFFFGRKKKPKEENFAVKPVQSKLSDPLKDSREKRVGALARGTRADASIAARNTEHEVTALPKAQSFEERVQAARARLQAAAEKKQAERLASRNVADNAGPKFFSSAVRPGITDRLRNIGRPVDELVRQASSRANFPRNPDVVPQVKRPSFTESHVSDMVFRRFTVYLQEKSGIVLADGKQYLVSSRLSPLLSRFHCDSVDTLVTRCMDETDRSLTEEVIDAMTTNETLWFRDTYPYLALQNVIIPDLVMRGTDREVRIWSAACSSGQEPFSIAITILEMMGRMVHVDPSLVKIIGTDLSAEMLQRCREGLYDAHALSRGLTAERRAKFFKPTHNPNLMRIDPRVSRMVEFRPLNLLGSFALMGRFDVIFCRNVLIYFNNEVKRQILKKFLYCLNPGGYLILGATETVAGIDDKFEMISCHPGIIYKLRS